MNLNYYLILLNSIAKMKRERRKKESSAPFSIHLFCHYILFDLILIAKTIKELTRKQKHRGRKSNILFKKKKLFFINVFAIKSLVLVLFKYFDR